MAGSGATFTGLTIGPTLVTTTGAVALGMAFGLFGRKRRDDESDDVLSAAAASGVGFMPNGAVAVAGTVDGIAAASGAVLDANDAEALMPRWRRPSLIQARKADPIRDNTPAAAPDLRSGPRRPARGSRAAGHPLSRRPPAGLARRAARRRDRLPRPGRRGPAAREVRRVLAGPEPGRPAGLAPQDDPRRGRRPTEARRAMARSPRCRTLPTPGRWAIRRRRRRLRAPTSSRAPPRRLTVGLLAQHQDVLVDDVGDEARG